MAFFALSVELNTFTKWLSNYFLVLVKFVHEAVKN